MHENLKNISRYTDGRGEIQMILESCDIGSISRIVTVPNSFRARHMHPTDTHYCEIITGEVEYYERKTGSGDKPSKNIFRDGDIIYTPNGYDHEMFFNLHTVMNCYSKLPRTTKNYEKETIRFTESLKEIYDKCEE